MKPAPFDYFDPDSLDEALDLLNEYGDDATIIAGGQSLGPILNMRLSTPKVIVDLNRVTALDYQREENGELALGAMTRQSTLEDEVTLQTCQPLVATSLPYIGHRAIRNRGTVGGSVAHADPAAEWPALILALDGSLIVRRVGGDRVITADDFFVWALTNALAPEEALVEIRLPTWPKGAGWSFIEFSRRHGDFAVLGVAIRIRIDEEGRCIDARVVLIGGGPTPMRARHAETMLDAEIMSQELFTEVAQQASREIDPDDDIHASADYRRHLAKVLVSSALQQAAQRATNGGGLS